MSSSARVAVVTGAAGEIGLETARQLCRDGWAVVLTDRRDQVPTLAREVAAEAADSGHERPVDCVGVAGDVTDPALADQVFAAAARLGSLRALVNNAGDGGPDKAALDVSVGEFRQVLEVNLVAPFALATRAAGVMVAHGHGGRIVNMGSVFGQQAVLDGVAYCSSKGGLGLLTQALALEWGPHGITVNTVAPGYILTDMHREEIASRARRSGRSEAEEQAALAASVPVRRHGVPADIAEVVRWLLSPAASYVTGQTIPVNGGILLS